MFAYRKNKTCAINCQFFNHVCGEISVRKLGEVFGKSQMSELFGGCV